MEKSTYIVLIAIAVFLVLFFGMQFVFSNKEATAPASETKELPSLTSEECTTRGGDVINTLNEKNIYAPSDILGEVEGTRCPCLCVRRQNNSEMFFSD
jgi:hypothetical protein